MRRVVVVAEAAQGFEGRSVQAQLLVRAAAAGRADVVKFQLVYADELALPSYKYYDLFRTLEMSDDEWRGVAAEANRRQVGLAFDVYGARSLALAVELGAVSLKIHSTDFFNDSLVSAAIASGLDVWFSIGGITVEEVREFLQRHQPVRPDQLTLLYGFQAEPTPTGDNHLSRLLTLHTAFPSLALGFMDHAEAGTDEATWLGLLALPLGVRVIEKHVTAGRGLELEDYVSALDAVEFGAYVARVRAAEQALGEPAVDNTEGERAYRGRALKCVVAARDLAAGRVLELSDLDLKRSAARAEPPVHRLDAVVGRALRAAVAAGTPVCLEDLA